MPPMFGSSAENWRRLWQFETRALVAATLGTVGSGLMLVVAACTNHWADLSLRTADGRSITGCQGLWKIKYHVGDQVYDYVLIHLFNSDHKRQVDDHVTTLIRTTVSFLGMSLLLLVLSNVFAVYSLKHPRFTFKRAAAALYGMTMACLVVCIDVYSRMLRAEKADQKLIRFPKSRMAGSASTAAPSAAVTPRPPMPPTEDDTRANVLVQVLSWSYGYSLAFVVVAAVANGAAACLFLLYSRKLKGTRAPNQKTAEANEEVLIGRV